MIDQKLTQRIRKRFDRDHVQVNATDKRIEVYWMRDPRGKVWIPFAGGPLYAEQAIEAAKWLQSHLEEFRSLLPKQLRDFPIVLGELDTRTFPGDFYPVK